MFGLNSDDDYTLFQFPIPPKGMIAAIYQQELKFTSEKFENRMKDLYNMGAISEEELQRRMDFIAKQQDAMFEQYFPIEWIFGIEPVPEEPPMRIPPPPKLNVLQNTTLNQRFNRPKQELPVLSGMVRQRTQPVDSYRKSEQKGKTAPDGESKSVKEDGKELDKENFHVKASVLKQQFLDMMESDWGDVPMKKVLQNESNQEYNDKENGQKLQKIDRQAKSVSFAPFVEIFEIDIAEDIPVLKKDPQEKVSKGKNKRSKEEKDSHVARNDNKTFVLPVLPDPGPFPVSFVYEKELISILKSFKNRLNESVERKVISEEEFHRRKDMLAAQIKAKYRLHFPNDTSKSRVQQSSAGQTKQSRVFHLPFDPHADLQEYQYGRISNSNQVEAQPEQKGKTARDAESKSVKEDGKTLNKENVSVKASVLKQQFLDMMESDWGDVPMKKVLQNESNQENNDKENGQKMKKMGPDHAGQEIDHQANLESFAQLVELFKIDREKDVLTFKKKSQEVKPPMLHALFQQEAQHLPDLIKSLELPVPDPHTSEAVFRAELTRIFKVFKNRLNESVERKVISEEEFNRRKNLLAAHFRFNFSLHFPNDTSKSRVQQSSAGQTKQSRVVHWPISNSAFQQGRRGYDGAGHFQHQQLQQQAQNLQVDQQYQNQQPLAPGRLFQGQPQSANDQHGMRMAKQELIAKVQHWLNDCKSEFAKLK